MSGRPEHVHGFGIGDDREINTVYFQNLIASSQAQCFDFAIWLDFRDENAVAALVSARYGEVQYIVLSIVSSQIDVSRFRFGRQADVQQPELSE